MSTGAKTLLAVVFGVISGWFLLAGFCRLPTALIGSACGHNAPLLIPLFLTLGVVLCWLALSRLARRRRG